MKNHNDFTTALIGCGRIGFLLENDPLRNKPCTHYGGAKAAGIRIDYACDHNMERLRGFAKTAGIPARNAYADYHELIHNAQPGLVIIATHTASHAEIALHAARSGAAVIICEKPLASSLPDAKELVDECEKRGVCLIVNHERRYDARYRAVKEMLTAGRIGEIKTVHAAVLTSASSRKARIEDGGGPLLHDGTHMIDIIRYFFGDIASVRGEMQGQKNNFEDRAAAWLKTCSGIDIFLEAGGSRNYFMFELDINGTSGRIVIGNGYQRLYGTRKSRLYTGFSDLAEEKFPSIKGMNCFKKEYIEAKEILNGKIDKAASSGYDGYKTLEAIHTIYHSAYLKGKTIELPVKPEKINLKKIFGL